MAKNKINKSLKASLIRDHDKINSFHDNFVNDGFIFTPKKTRFWLSKDNSISVLYVYIEKDDEKTEPKIKKQASALMHLSKVGERIVVRLKDLKFSISGKL